jgi:hypothetical protein
VGLYKQYTPIEKMNYPWLVTKNKQDGYTPANMSTSGRESDKGRIFQSGYAKNKRG